MHVFLYLKAMFNKRGKDFDNLGTVPDEKTEIRSKKSHNMLGRSVVYNLFNNPKI